MPRKPNITPSIALNLMLPEDIRTRLDLVLFSELEGRVPHGAYQEFFVRRIEEFFNSVELDLSPYDGSQPGTFKIRGKPEDVMALKNILEGGQ